MASPLSRLLKLARGWIWDHSLAVRRPLWAIRTRVSVIKSRLLEPDRPPRVLLRSVRAEELQLIQHPAVAVRAHGSSDASGLARALEAQTEPSWTLDSDAEASFVWMVSGGSGCLESLPAAHLESMLMVAAAEDLGLVAGGRLRLGMSARSAHGVECWPGAERAEHLLWKVPARSIGGAAPPDLPVMGRAVPHISSGGELESTHQGADALDIDSGGLIVSDAHLLMDNAGGCGSVCSMAFDVERRLGRLPVIPGPPTVLFLLPFLAVGGAERLLLDLLEGLIRDARCLVVTTEPHSARLGQTVSRFRKLIPHIFTIGDWLSRESHASAITHLIRRYRVETVFCWNGCTCFYDLAPELRARGRRLRIINQLFNHEGGWIEHYGPRLRAAVDIHVAVNTVIASALISERGVAESDVVTIHHGVRAPEAANADEQAKRRAALRAELGLPSDSVVIGTFIRMSEQKRPLDVIALARRLRDRPVSLLLVGGGPLDEAVDAEIARQPVPNLTRLPLQQDAMRLYDAIDICLMTSQFEGLPVFLLDGMARCKPAIAPDVGDIGLLLEQGGGILVPRPGDLCSFEQAVDQMLEPGRLREEGMRARQRVEARFGLERYVEAYRQLIWSDARQGEHR